MKEISNLTFPQLKNAEHVAFFNNVAIELEKKTAESLGLTFVDERSLDNWACIKFKKS